MALSTFEQQVAALGLSFDLPTESARRLDLSEQDYRMLLLAGISAIAQAGGAGSTQRVAVTTTATADGTVVAGAKYVSFIISGDFAGTINGATYTGADDAFTDLPYLPGADTYGDIFYTISAGSLRITRIA